MSDLFPSDRKKPRNRSQYSDDQLRIIDQEFPRPVLRELSIDALVIEFLKLHDVDARPPGGRDVVGDAFRGAITGAAGIEAGATMQLEKNQRSIAAAQEWTSWKQWALSHQDWKEFKESQIKLINEHNEAAQARWEERWNNVDYLWEIDNFITKYQEEQKRNLKAVLFLLVGLCVFGIVIIAIGQSVKNTPSSEPLYESDPLQTL